MKIKLFIIMFIISQNVFANSFLFESGKNYYLLDGKVNLRLEPNLKSKVIGQIERNEQIYIIECAYNEQIIDDIYSYWYKIRHNNIDGFIWGGYIAVDTFVFDVDSNGINDYFHFRFSSVVNNINNIRGNQDIIIYINNKKIKCDFDEPSIYTSLSFTEGEGWWPVATDGVILSVTKSDLIAREISTKHYYISQTGEILFRGSTSSPIR
jgi:hypothetical protein